MGAIAKSASSPATLRPVLHWIWLVAIAGGALIAAFAFSKAQPKAQPAAGDDAAVFTADKALDEAMRTGDKAAARRLLGLQFRLVDADGKVYARRDVLADLKGMAFSPAGDLKIHTYGLVAVVTGRRKSVHDADIFFLNIWVRQKGAWRALLMQEVATVAEDVTTAAAATLQADSQPYECKNPCRTIPYRVRSAAEQEVISTFQTVMTAIVAHDAAEWARHVADEFTVYASGRAPVAKAGRVAAIERQKEDGAAVAVGEVQAMRLSVYGDGAVMMTADAVPGAAHPPYRAARVWTKRDGRWLMAISAHTDVREPGPR
jgi:hypothetical protein